MVQAMGQQMLQGIKSWKMAIIGQVYSKTPTSMLDIATLVRQQHLENAI